MAYKFQLGEAQLSGALVQEGAIKVHNEAGTEVANFSQAGVVSGSGAVEGASLNFDQGLINSDGAGGLAVDSLGDGTATLQAGSLTGAVNVTGSGQIAGTTAKFGGLNFEGQNAYGGVLTSNNGVILFGATADQELRASSLYLSASAEVVSLTASANVVADKLFGDGAGITNINVTNLDAAGSNTQIQFNQNGEFAGDAGLTYNGSGSLFVSGTSGGRQDAYVWVGGVEGAANQFLYSQYNTNTGKQDFRMNNQDGVVALSASGDTNGNGIQLFTKPGTNVEYHPAGNSAFNVRSSGNPATATYYLSVSASGEVSGSGDLKMGSIYAADLSSGSLPLVSSNGQLADDDSILFYTSRSFMNVPGFGMFGYNALSVSSSLSGSTTMADGLLAVLDASENDVLIAGPGSVDLGYNDSTDEAYFSFTLQDDGDPGEFKLLSDGATIFFGADSDVSLMHVADTGLRLENASGLSFREGGININSDATGYLDIAAGTEVRVSTALSASGNFNIGGTLNADNLGTIALGAIDVASDLMVVNDGAAGAIKNMSLANYATKLAGAGLSATAGVLSTQAQSVSTIFNSNENIAEGYNIYTGSANISVTLPTGSGLTAGDVFVVKQNASGEVTLSRTGTDTIDGESSILLESPYAAVSLVYSGVDGQFRIV